MKTIDKDRLVGIYTTMVRIRTFEQGAVKLFEENRLRGSVHLYIGEEAVAATVCSRLRRDDYITSTHRGHGHCIAKGGSLDRTLAELKGKETGYCKGRGGSMHTAKTRQRGTSAPTPSSGPVFRLPSGPPFRRASVEPIRWRWRSSGMGPPTRASPTKP